MPTSALTLPRVLLVRDAVARFGLTHDAIAHALHTRRWCRITRGVLLTVPGPVTRDDWVHAGLALAGPHAALSGWDAARTVGVGTAQPPVPQVLVLDRRGANRTLAGVHVRPTARPYTCTMLPSSHPTLAYVPVVHPARAIADAALTYRTLTPVRAMVATSVQCNVCRPEEDLLTELARAPRAGSRWLRQALADVANGAKSIAEAQAVDLLTAARVPRFEVNVPIVDRRGVLVAEADILWRALRVITEVDSREFHFNEDDWKATGRRHTFLTRHGFAVEHHAPSDIRAGGRAWARGVAEGSRARARELGVPYVAGRGPVPVPPQGHPPVVLP